MMRRARAGRFRADAVAGLGLALALGLLMAVTVIGAAGLRAAGQDGAALAAQTERALALGRVAAGFAEVQRRVPAAARDIKSGDIKSGDAKPGDVTAGFQDLRAQVLAARDATSDPAGIAAWDRLAAALDDYGAGPTPPAAKGKGASEGALADPDGKAKAVGALIQAEIQDAAQVTAGLRAGSDDDGGTSATLVGGLGGLAAVIGALSVWWGWRRSVRLTADIDAVTGDLTLVFAGLAEGDLTRKVGGRHHAAFETMADDVNATVDKLAGMVTRINDTAGTIAAAATQVAAGGTDLADRTERQAAALEQTAAALEQLANIFKGYCDHAHEANTLVADARKAGESGVVVVASAIEAMRRIVDASEKIKDIIRVTEEISRRTNMLAINAAVEAARAGEAGKGFGVVAREVGSLAERSALASQQIKDLIFNSDTQIHQGVRMVTQSGDALQTIVGAVDRAAALFNDIAISAASQSGMLHEINFAVTRMDETTQMNAALAEQTCAASQSMRREAGSLKELVSFFMVDRNRPSQGLGRHIVLIESTKLDHTSFMTRIREVIAGRRDLRPEDVPDHHHCRLGKWYESVEVPAVRLSPVFRALDRPHALVHEAARCALQRHAAGDQAGCEQSLAEMTQASSQVLALIDDLAADLRSHGEDQGRDRQERAGSGAARRLPHPAAGPPRLGHGGRSDAGRSPSLKAREALRHADGDKDHVWAEF